jgi:hypothetical protein
MGLNQYSELLYFLKGLCEDHPLVNTVTKGKAENVDLNKTNIFPLVHITIEEARFTNGSTIIFPVTLEALAVRDINKEIVDDKFWGNDNEVDNHNETLSILNDVWTRMYRDFSERNITASENPTLTKIEFERSNILDGWGMTFDVELPNITLSLCQ